MNMKRLFLALMASVALPLAGLAQDDMYFVPIKANVEKSKRDYGMPRDTYYSGSDRSVDEYNRRGSYFHEIDSAGNDIVDFDAVVGAYPDSLTTDMSEDYKVTRRMSRFDDYSWSDPYWAGYYAGRSSWYGWYDPWYSPGWYGWYDPWYCGWYDPWYYGWHSPWYGYHGWYGWHGGYWGGPHYVTVRGGGPAGTHNRAHGVSRLGATRHNDVSSVSNGIANRSRRTASGLNNRNFSATNRFGVSRTNTTMPVNTTRRPSSSSFGSSRSGGSFGGSRSGGSFGGGGRSVGGGARSGGGFGGRR